MLCFTCDVDLNDIVDIFNVLVIFDIRDFEIPMICTHLIDMITSLSPPSSLYQFVTGIWNDHIIILTRNARRGLACK